MVEKVHDKLPDIFAAVAQRWEFDLEARASPRRRPPETIAFPVSG